MTIYCNMILWAIRKGLHYEPYSSEQYRCTASHSSSSVRPQPSQFLPFISSKEILHLSPSQWLTSEYCPPVPGTGPAWPWERVLSLTVVVRLPCVLQEKCSAVLAAPTLPLYSPPTTRWGSTLSRFTESVWTLLLRPSSASPPHSSDTGQAGGLWA